eukprot:5385382-Prymnesium_polylepis.6
MAEQTSAHAGAVHSVGFSPDSTRVVSGSTDLSIRLWGDCSLACTCVRARVCVYVYVYVCAVGGRCVTVGCI